MFKFIEKMAFAGVCYLLLPVSAHCQRIDAGVTDTTVVDTVMVDQTAAAEDNTDYKSATADKRSFNTIGNYAQQQVIVKNIPEDFVKQLQNDPAFGYVKTGLGKKTEEKSSGRSYHLGWLSLIPYIAIVIFILLLIWYLSSNKFIFFKKKSTAVAAGPAADADKDIFSINYAVELRKALEQGNYRLAIRLQYLELLKILSEKQLIHFKPDKTNFDYLLQLRSSGYYDDFFAATRNYEYSWYGLFDITEPLYQKINNPFLQLKQKIK
ncbi:MAG: hypothetical protein J7539_06420 [Niabella sp.]|nr:hypothetical protein [Niabella sp.]